MKNLLCAVLLTAFGVCVSAQETPVKKTSLFFRYGKILSAEACDSRPAIENPTPVMKQTSGAKYVQIIFKPDRGRSLSIHDFVLADPSGKEYPCIAVAEGDKPYSGIAWIYRDLDGKNYCRMLFAVSSADGEFTLKFKLFPTRIEEKTFKLKSVGSFSAAGAIPADGKLILPDPPPPPKPAEPEPAAEEKKEGEGEKKEGEGNNGKDGEKKDGGNPPE